MGVTKIPLIVLNTQLYKTILQSKHIRIFKMLYIQPQIISVPVSMDDFMSRPQRRLPCRRTFDMFSPFTTVIQGAGGQAVLPKRQKTANRTSAGEKFPNTISMNLAGFKPEDIKINMTKAGVINVVAQRINSDDDSGRMFQQMRCFQRSVKVPDYILAQGAEKIKSVLTDGVLQFTFPMVNVGSPKISTESSVVTAVEESSPIAGKDDCAVRPENTDRDHETCQIEVSQNDEKL